MGSLRRLIATTALTATLAAGCGDESETPPAAEPAVSPPAVVNPGQVLRLGGELEGVASDPRSGLAAVIVRRPQRSELALVDVDRRRVVRRVPLPDRARHLQLARPGGPILVPVEGADELASVAIPSGRIDTFRVGDFPHDATAIGDRIFVGNESGDSITAVEAGKVVDTVPTPEQPGGLAAGRGIVAVVAVGERVLTTYDARSLEELGSVEAGTGPTHVVAAGRRAFVVDTTGNAVLEFDIGRDPRPVSTTRAGGTPYGIAIDTRRDRLWVTLTARNEAAEYTITTNGLRLLDRYPTVRQPNTIAVDLRSGDALVAGRSPGGPLQRISPTP